MRRILLILACGLTALRLQAADPVPVPATLVAPQPTPNITFAVVPGVETDHNIIAQGEFGNWPHISLKEAQRLHGMKGVVFADARSKVEWDQSHIPGALPAPLGEFDAYYKKYKKKYDKARYIVVYCHGVGCHLSDMAAKNFVGKGYKNVVNFYGGWPDWTAAQLPVEDMRGKAPKPAPVPSPMPPAAATPTKP